MSGRRTKKWTNTAAEAFEGESGVIGDGGENTSERWLREMFGDRLKRHQDPSNQKAGKDFTIDGRGVDIKTNLHGGDVAVDAGKIWSSEAEYWLHVDRLDTEHVIYKVERMRAYIRENKIPICETSRGPVYWIPRKVAETL